MQVTYDANETINNRIMFNIKDDDHLVKRMVDKYFVSYNCESCDKVFVHETILQYHKKTSHIDFERKTLLKPMIHRFKFSANHKDQKMTKKRKTLMK